MKEFAKMLMVLESNIKTIRPITAALTRLLIELRLKRPSQQYFCHVGTPPGDREILKGPNPIQFATSQANHALSLRLRLRFISILYQ